MAFLSNISLTEVVERVRQLDADKIKMCAKQLRVEATAATLLPDEYLCNETLLESAITSNKTELPPTWLIFMQTLLSAKNQKLGERSLQKAKSIFCDIILYHRKNTPKHVALAESVHLSRSKHLITMLNKLGHCISYQAVKDLDTEITRAILSEN